MKRRDLLKAAVITPFAVTGCGGGAAWPGTDGLSTQAPSSSSTSNRGTTSPAPVVGAIQLTLTTPAAGEQPFTVGQLFAKGHIPAGTSITSNVTKFQADVRNRWPDGSARFAVLSGVAPAGTVSIVKGGTPFVGASVAEPAVDATLTFRNVVAADGTSVAGGSWTASLAVARANGDKAWSRSTAHRVRQILGPVMSEFHYFVPTPDPHTHVWFYVRAYSTGHVEIETVVENGWFNVAAPGQRNYDVTVSVDGVARYDGTNVAHYHHTRWSRVDWVGTDPQVVPKHDVAYLQTIDGIPKLAVSSLTSTAYTNEPGIAPKFSSWTREMSERPTPFAAMNVAANMGGGGYGDWVALFAPWEMTYLAEGDPRALWAIVGNARNAGRYSTHYRDENTGRVVRGSDRAAWGFSDSNVAIAGNAGNSTNLTPAPSGGQASTWAISHQPSVFMGYLLTGRWMLQEEVQFKSMCDLFVASPAWVRNGYKILRNSNQVRDFAWGWRNLAQANIVVPEYLNGVALTGEDALTRSYLGETFSRTINEYYNLMLGTGSTHPWRNNAFGLIYHTQDHDSVAGRFGISGMMEHYLVSSVMWSALAEAGSNSNLLALGAFTARFPTGLLGGDGSTAWDWRFHTFYDIPFSAEDPSTIRANWNEQWTWLNAVQTWNGSNPASVQANNHLYRIMDAADGNLPACFKLEAVGNAVFSDVDAAIVSIAMARDLAEKVAIPGASAAASRYYGSSTWANAVSSVFAGRAAHAYRARSHSAPATSIQTNGSSLPYAIPTAGQVVAIGVAAGSHGNAGSIKPSDWGSYDAWYRSLFDSFGGGVFVPAGSYSSHGAYVLAGTGGHNHPDHIGAVVFNFSTGRWERLDVANTGSFNTGGTPYTAEQTSGAPYHEVTGTEVPAPPHSYASLAYMPSGAKGSVVYVTRAAALTTAAGYSPSVHRFDLATRLWSRAAPNASFSTHETDVLWDAARNRWWVLIQPLHNWNRMPYLDASDMTWKQTAAASANFNGPTQSGTAWARTMLHDGLLLRCKDDGLWLYDPTDATTQAQGWIQCKVSGTLPPGRTRWTRFSNGNWYSFNAFNNIGSSTTQIDRIQPPADPKTGTWVADTIDLNSPIPGLAPFDGTYQSGHYTRLFYVPSIDCLAWMPGKDWPVYIFKPGR